MGQSHIMTIKFGPNVIPLSQVFLRTRLTYALVNLKPIREQVTKIQ